MVNDNSAEHSLSLYHTSLAASRERGVNIFFIQTPWHYIQVMFPFKLGPIEISHLSVIGLDKADEENYMVETKHEEPLVNV